MRSIDVSFQTSYHDVEAEAEESLFHQGHRNTMIPHQGANRNALRGGHERHQGGKQAPGLRLSRSRSLGQDILRVQHIRCRVDESVHGMTVGALHAGVVRIARG
jgi:hypothetical protein